MILDRAARWLGRRGDAFWLAALAVLSAVITLPGLSAFPLWDPQESQLTQIAWEMQERNTWLLPWYRGHELFSEPILPLWLARAGLGALWDPRTAFADPQLGARLPFALVAVLGVLLHYDWVRRLFGRPVALLAAVVLASAPQYLFVGRQVMVEGPFVATYGAALGYFAVGLFTPRPALPEGVRGAARLRHELVRDAPLLAAWALLALAVLAKGFMPPALAACCVAVYGLATLRRQDHLRKGDGRLASMMLPAVRHLRELLRRLRAGRGLLLFVALAAPWFAGMTAAYGEAYWREWFWVQHLGRAAGAIERSPQTFDFFVMHLGVALFPWSAFLLAALWRFGAASNPRRSVAGRRNLWVLCGAAVPFAFFSVGASQLPTYVLPMLPFLAVVLAAALLQLGKEPLAQPALAEPEAAGSAVRSVPEPEAPWWHAPDGRGTVVLVAVLSAISFAILAHDLALDFRLFLRLFVSYGSRATPNEYYPMLELQLVFLPLGAAIATLLWSRFVSRWHVGAFAAGAISLACYLGWVMMPAMGDTYSYEPFYAAYHDMAKPGEDIGQYTEQRQPERSVSFLFQNRAKHLDSDAKTAAFLKRPGRKFILVDQNRLPALRRVARSVDKTLFVVFDRHPFGRLVSDEPNEKDGRRVADNIMRELPPGVQQVPGGGARFGDSLTLVATTADRAEVRPGETIKVSFYYRADKLMDQDWQIFVHGDGPSGGSHRVHLDHFPVGGLYPTPEWQVGEIVRDDFEVPVPADYPYDSFVLWTGWYRGDNRMQLGGGVAQDGDNRFRGPTIRVRQD